MIVGPRRLQRAGLQLVALADPTARLAASRVEQRPTPITFASVYRARNAADVVKMIEPLTAVDAAVRLWSLDDVPDVLRQWTRGSGPGRRFELLNRLLVDATPGWTVLADDDVRFKRGDLLDLVAVAAQVGLDISQPAHALGSNVSHSFTRVRPFSVARLTSFVEIGPVVVLSPAAVPHVVPMPVEGMGWGTELAWSELQRTAGLTLGIVDAVRIDHRGEVGAAYSSEAEFAHLRELFARHGVDDWSTVQRTHRYVRPWGFVRKITP